MPARFAADGISLQYPENWTLEQETGAEGGWTILLQSPATAFLTLTFDPDGPPPPHLAATVLATLREEYEGLEAEEVVAVLGDQPAVGHDIRFFTLDFTNTCWTRAFETAAGTILVLCQMTDAEEAVNAQVLRAICASLRVDER